MEHHREKTSSANHEPHQNHHEAVPTVRKAQFAYHIARMPRKPVDDATHGPSLVLFFSRTHGLALDLENLGEANQLKAGRLLDVMLDKAFLMLLLGKTLTCTPISALPT